MEKETYQELIGQGVLLMSAEKYAKAKEYFEKAASILPEEKEAYVHLGNANVNLDLFDDALDNFQKAVRLDPEDGELYFSLGNLYILKKDIPRCVENFNLAEEKGFHHVELYANLAAIYMNEGEHMQAIRVLNKAIKIEPMRADLRIEKAKMYIVGEHYPEALETLEELQRLFPDAFEAYDLQTQIYILQKKSDKALNVISTGVDRFPEDAVLRWIKIKVLVDMGENAKAKDEIAVVRSLKDYSEIAREVAIQEAIIYAGEDDMVAVTKVLEGALEYEKEGETDGQCRFMLLSAYYGMKNYEKALEQAEKLATLDDGSLFWVSGKYYVAQLHKVMGQEDAAKEEMKRLAVEFRKLTIAEPTFYEVYMYRLLCHKELGEFDKALELADYMEALFPNESDAYAFRAQIYLDMGRTEEAEAEKQKARERNPRLVI